jgi:hypothetical protein
MPQDPYAAIAQPISADPYAGITTFAPPTGTPSLANAPGAPSSMPAQKGALAPVPSSILDLPSSAYHSPLQTLIGAAKGVIPAIQAGLPHAGQANVEMQPGVNPWRHLPVAAPRTPATPTEPGFVDSILAPSNAAQESGATIPGLIGTAAGLVQTGKGLLGRPNTLPPGKTAPNNFTGENASRTWAGQPTSNAQYSTEGSHFAAPLRSNSAVDMPAEAHNALPDLKRSAADLGIDPARDFTGRNGLLAARRVTNHAIELTEAEAKTFIDPVRGVEVPHDSIPTELKSEFTPEQLKKGVTVGDVDAARVDLNKRLRAGNFYSKAPSAQYAAQDPLASAHAAVEQARDIVYGAAEQASPGSDLRGLKGRESSAIKLADSVDSTAKTLSQQTAKYESASPGQKVLGTIKNIRNIRANPTNAFEPSLSNPTDEFNRNMQAAFQGVKPAPGSVMKNGRLLAPGPAVLTPPPGVTPPEPGRQLQLSLEPNKPGPGYSEAPQDPLIEHGYHNVPRQDLTVAPPPSEPTPLQNLLTFAREAHPTDVANVPRSLGAAAAAPEVAEIPEALRKAAGLRSSYGPPKADFGGQVPLENLGFDPNPPKDYGAAVRSDVERRMGGPLPRGVAERRVPTAPQGGHAGNGVSSVEELSRPGSNYVVSKQGKLTYHGKSFAPEETPVGGAHVTVLPNGEFRVNEGTLSPAMTTALKNGLKK